MVCGPYPGSPSPHFQVSLRRELLPEALAELLQAAEWYEDRRLRLGEEFLGAVEQAMDAVAAAPSASAAWPGSVRHRRRMMKKFPYMLVYEVRSDSVEFVAIAHTKREPGYWLERIRTTDTPKAEEGP